MTTPVVTEAQPGAAPSASPARKSRSRLRLLLSVVLVLLLLAILALAGGSWYFSSKLLDVSPFKPTYSTQVLAIRGNAVQLNRTNESTRNQVNGLVWPGGRTVVGKVLSSNRSHVLRTLLGPTHGLRVGTHVGFDNHVYTSPAALHIHYRAVRIPDRLGPMPDWYVPGPRSTWVIMVHGYTVDRSEGLRPLPVLVHLGLPVLLISYRNDVGAPSSSDHLYHLGATEWQDVEPAARYAFAHGARSLILYGYSMGGNTVESFLHHSRYAPHVRAAVLDAPVLDWKPVLDLAASERHLPGILAAVTERLVAFRLHLSSLDDINQVKAAGTLKAPTLVFHGTGDTKAPYKVSVAFARARPDIVMLVLVPKAEHVESWNMNPARYDARLRAFLTRVLR